MKKWTLLSSAALFSLVLGGCTSAYYASSGYAGDDLYATHDKTAIARRQQEAAEARRAEAEARRAEWEARIAEAEAAAAENKYRGTVAASDSRSYSGVLADTYESAYARRLYGFESLTYRLPSSYFDFRYGNAFTYVSAYDPAFYNIVISGNQVWVEPKYISSMFGTWGATVLTGGWYGGWYGGWNYGWAHNPLWWGYGAWGWNWGFAWHPWHSPVYRPGWGHYAWGPWHGPGGGGYRPPHNYRLDSYRRTAGAAGWRSTAPAGNRSSRPSGANTGRRPATGNNRNGSYNSRPANPGNNANSRSNYNNYNNGTSGRSNNSGGYSGGYSGGSSGRSNGSSSGGGSYNRGR